MGNCLKTQLKENVQNTNLLKIGEMLFVNDQSDSVTVMFAASKTGVFLSDLDGNMIVGDQEVSNYEIPLYANQVTIPSGHRIKLSDKYSLVVFQVTSALSPTFPITELQYIPLITLKSTVSGTLNIDCTTLTKLGLMYSLDSSIKSITAHTPNVNIVEIIAIPNAILSDLTNLTNLQDIIWSGNSIASSMESYVWSIRPKKSSGSVSFTWSQNLTFNGSTISVIEGTPKVLSWTADTITFDGVTINA